MRRAGKRHLPVMAQLMLLFALLLIAFTLAVGLLYNRLMRRQSIAHYTQNMQRHAYAISQNLAEMIVPDEYEGLDETRFIVSEDTLAPYMALIEQMTHCNVYLVDVEHNVTGYFDGVVQRLERPLLSAYIEQTIALGFMGKTPTIQARSGGDTHLTAAAPIMNAQSRVLGVVLLESTLRELGYAQVPSAAILLTSFALSFLLAVLLALLFSRRFTLPISRLQRVALALAGGDYATRTRIARGDEIGSLAASMDVLAERLEEARRRDDQLRAQQQRFFSNISHELRTPVTVIRGSLEALDDGVVRGEENVRAYYRQMIAESRWLQRLIADLLELSRLQSLEFSPDMGDVELSELLGDVAMSAHALCERKGVALACEEPQSHYTLRGDYARLRQMLLAVVDNAVKFTPPGKTIRIALHPDAPVITVEDEGEGIAPDELAHIFDRFHHTRDASRQSTGLGLTIVQEIARRHGVTVSVESAPGAGTMFTFTFPRTYSAKKWKRRIAHRLPCAARIWRGARPFPAIPVRGARR